MRRTLGGAGLAAVALAAMIGPALAQSSSSTEKPSRPRIVIRPQHWIVEPPPSAKRYCRSWLVKEYRVSGPVIVPKMQCWWQ
jgi:hypothetical protein